MKKDYSHISVVLDRSGSMSSIVNDTIGGFNTFLKTQKETPGDATFSLIQFDTQIETVYSFLDIKEVPELNTKTFVPRGGTSLYDAIGQTIVECGETLAALPEALRPNKVIVVIITDGDENSSRKYNHKMISTLIKDQNMKYDWTFIFLGANIDGRAVGTHLGIDADFSVTFGATAKGVDNTFDMLGGKLGTMRRSAGPLYSMGMKTAVASAVSYTSADRLKSMGDEK